MSDFITLSKIADELVQQEFFLTQLLKKNQDLPPCIHDALDSISHAIHSINEVF